MWLPVAVGVLCLATACASDSGDAQRNAASGAPASGAVGFTTNPVDARMVNKTGSELLLECKRPEEDHVVADGQSVEVTGHEGWTSSDSDVWCVVTVRGGTMGEASFDAQIKNPTIGQPEVTIDTDSHDFGEGDTWTSNYNFVHVDVERLADTSNDHKSFVLTFRL